ncbi:MAG: phosphoribosylamine--glycine ligase [Ignavibacteria bacterium]|nr:phosphoribosylamine--glycine ligase [Ignavibacteria bacterium]
MKILIIGNGGREHSIAVKICGSKSFIDSKSILYCTIGNPGIDKIAQPVNIKPTDISSLLNFALKEKIDFTVVGPEIPLSLGIADEFISKNLSIFGPVKSAAEIETSKIFAKDFMRKHGIPSAKFKSFSSENIGEVKGFIETLNFPIVIKADGLAAGKGVCIAESHADADSFITDLTSAKIFGESGSSFIIEEYLEGFELSIFAITDGKDYVLLPAAQDHKRIGEGDTGKNTGGMGSYAPADALIDDITYQKIKERIIEPVISGMSKSGREYKGCLYCGLMICGNKGNFEPYVIEFNCRFGDPETQAVLPLIKSDFLELLIASANGNIKNYKLEINNLYAGCVVAASKGYPDKYETGKVISGLDNIPGNVNVIHSGTVYSDDRKDVITSGGRVLSLVGFSDKSLTAALENAYKGLESINFDNICYRKDIGRKFYELLRQKD